MHNVLGNANFTICLHISIIFAPPKVFFIQMVQQVVNMLALCLYIIRKPYLSHLIIPLYPCLFQYLFIILTYNIICVVS